MPKFLNPFEQPAYFEQALFLYAKYAKFLEDDFARNNKPFLDYFFELAKKSLFFVIVENDIVSGFVYLDNFIGDGQRFYSAEITTCFDKRFWGDYTKKCGKNFLKKCFKDFGLKKIKALIYSENFRVKTLLKAIGFEKEALLKCETLRNGKPQDIEIYSIMEVKNENRN